MLSSDTTELKGLFKKIAKQIHTHCEDKKQVEVESYEDSEAFKLVSYELNDVALYVDSEKKKTVAIAFTALNMNCYLTAEGYLQASGETPDEVFEIEEPRVVALLVRFLSWRLDVMQELNA